MYIVLTVKLLNKINIIIFRTYLDNRNMATINRCIILILNERPLWLFFLHCLKIIDQNKKIYIGQVPTYSKFDYLPISMHMHALALKPNRASSTTVLSWLWWQWKQNKSPLNQAFLQILNSEITYPIKTRLKMSEILSDNIENVDKTENSPGCMSNLCAGTYSKI